MKPYFEGDPDIAIMDFTGGAGTAVIDFGASPDGHPDFVIVYSSAGINKCLLKASDDSNALPAFPSAVAGAITISSAGLRGYHAFALAEKQGFPVHLGKLVRRRYLKIRVDAACTLLVAAGRAAE